MQERYSRHCINFTHSVIQSLLKTRVTLILNFSRPHAITYAKQFEKCFLGKKQHESKDELAYRFS